MNENDAYIFEVETPTDWTFNGEKTWVAGWFLSKNGAIFRDMRAWVDDRVFTGLFALPRPEIELRHRGWTGLPHAGFSFLIDPHPGARLLRLELLDHGNNWVEIWRRKIKVRRSRAPRRPRLKTSLVPEVLTALLKEQRAQPALDDEGLTRIAQRHVQEIAGEWLDVEPSPPFWGALEDPKQVGHTQFGKLPVVGWLIHEHQPIVRLTASADPVIENALVYGQGREDAARMFPQHPDAARSQFFGMADVNENLPNPLALKIYAELKDGSRHLVFVRRFRQLSCNEKERTYPEFDRARFWRALRALHRACQAQHVSLGPWRDFAGAALRAYRLFRDRAPASLAHLQTDADPYQGWLRTNRFSGRLRQQMERAAAALPATAPTFALVADARHCQPAHLERLAASLQRQIYPRWELRIACPAEAAGLAAAARGLAEVDPRIRVAVGPTKEFCATLNAAAHDPKATHLACLPAHSQLAPEALLLLAEQLHAHPDTELIYTDEDRIDATGRRSHPVFKPAWSPALALSGLFPGQLSVVRRDRFLQVGSFRSGFDAVPWHDLLLRLGDDLPATRVRHLAAVVHHACAEIPVEVDLVDPSVEQTRRALDETFSRRGWAAGAFLPSAAQTRRQRFHQPRWSSDLLARNPVTIVIPTRDRLHLLQECFELLNETVDWRHVHLIIVDDHSRDLDAKHFLTTIQRRAGLRCRVVRPADPQAPFNYSHLVNLALPHVETPLILHLNNDVNALEPGWLEDMVGWMTQSDVGVVGAKLVYPDKTLNHTGVVVGPHGGLADTPLARSAEADSPPEWHAVAREVSAVTGACLLTRTALYRELQGFDEQHLGVAYNDVDYCLRVVAAGHRVIYSPQAKLMHWGSATRGVTFDEAEHLAFLRRHAGVRDAYFPASLRLDATGRPATDPARSVHAGRAGTLRVLLLTHNLNLEGAPLFLLEYAEYLAREAGFALEVMTSQDGPLRANYEALGARITLIDRHPLYAAESPALFHERLEEVRRQVDFERIDLVVCNTLVSYWGVHLAHLAGKPSLFYIHESSSIFRFFEKALPLHMHAMVEEAFRLATRALFLCRATEAYYKDLDVNGNFRLVPSWIRIEAIEEFKRRHTRAELRRRHGYAEDDIIIANIGTVCERKGQHTFVRAVEHFNHLHGGGRGYRFLLVGGRAGIYLDLLTEEIRRMAIPNLEIVTETRAAYDYFALADMFVCSSFEESFPRVVLEAMAFRTPIVSTDVHGIPEMVTQRQDAYLVPPGDYLALSRMMKTCLDKEQCGKSLTPTAYSRVIRSYDYHQVLPYHVALAREAWLDREEA